jgi:hypothetical protein
MYRIPFGDHQNNNNNNDNNVHAIKTNFFIVITTKLNECEYSDA